MKMYKTEYSQNNNCKDHLPSVEKNEFFENGTVSPQIAGRRVWTVEDVAKYLGVSIGHVYNLKAEGKIPYRKRGKLLRFLPNEILAWLEGGVD
jgi:excisionase family DNA binding protein